MKTILYTFSTTDNSLITARILSQTLPYDTKIITTASLKDAQNIDVKESIVGFVFPIYYGDIAKRLNDVLRKRGQSLS